MTYSNYKYWSSIFIVILILISASCSRDVEDLELAEYPNTAEIFLDAPIALGVNAFYLPYAGSKLDAWSVDSEVSYEGDASMRIDVPNASDPDGNYAGAILRTEGEGRNLTEYNALTFWAKASRGVVIDQFGFGEDFIDNQYMVTRTGVALSTDWQKVVIPIPDPSKLVKERGMFRYAAGTTATDGAAYTFWVDNLQFENIGTLGQPRAMIQNGEDQVLTTFVDATTQISGLTYTANDENGRDITVDAASGYYNFASSNPGVAAVSDAGLATVSGEGQTTITATLGSTQASGSLTINSLGDFVFAPTPTRDPADVISIFSDAYDNVPVDYYNGFFTPDGQTTLGGTGEGGADLIIDDNGMINYTMLNFVGIGMFLNAPPIDATEMTHLHVDINVNEEIQTGDFIRLQLLNSVGNGETSGSYTISGDQLANGDWRSFDIPLSDFPGLASRSQIGLLFFVSDSTIGNILVDNIYFYKGEDSGGGGGAATPTEGAPAQTRDAATVISVFSDTYSNLGGTDFNPNWGQATSVSTEDIAGNPALKYGGLNYQGTQFASPIDASGMTHLHIDYFTGNSTLLNAFLISTGPVETAYSLPVPTDGWNSIDIPLTAFNPVDLRDIIQFKFDGNGDIYLDNMYFYAEDDSGGGGGGGATTPTGGAPAPTRDASNVVSLFSDVYTDVNVDTWRTEWSSANFEDVTVAGDAAKLYTSLDFVGIETTSSTVDASQMTHIHMDVWTPDATQIGIKLVDFGADGGFDGGDDSEFQIDIPGINQGQWVSIDIPLADFSGLTSRAHLAQYILVGQPTGATTLYVDNFYFYNENSGSGGGGGGATSPTSGAPAPTQGAADVISIFSDSYTNLDGTNLNPDWGQATVLSEVAIAGNNTLELKGLNYQGIELASSIDVSGMTHLHLDIWTANSTALNAFIISPGPVETAYAVSVPTDGWLSLEIPLTDFSPVDLANVFQFKFDGNGDIYIDNIYFHK